MWASRASQNSLVQLKSNDVNKGAALVAGAVQVVESVAVLRTIAPAATRHIDTLGFYSAGDNGGGRWYAITGAAAGTYSDNSGTVIVPNGGDGSAAWLRDFDGYKLPIEAFGGKSSDGAFDNAAVINSAQNYVRKLILKNADYWINQTINITKDGFELVGGGDFWTPTNKATRIIQQSATADIIYINNGTVTTTDTNSFIRGVRVKNLDLLRVAMTAPAAGAEFTAGAGVRIKHAIYTYLNDVKVSECNIGVLLYGTVRTYLDDVDIFRSTAITATNPADDFFYGVVLDGSANIGLAGGNASTYITRTSAELGGAPVLKASKGFYLTQNFVDTFLMQPETLAVEVGIDVDGGSSTTVGNVDLHITNPVNDGFLITGIMVQNTNNNGIISIISPYGAPAADAVAAGALASYFINNSKAMLTISALQSINNQHSSCMGVFVQNSENVHLESGGIASSARPLAFVGCNFCRAALNISQSVKTTTQAAVYLSDSDNNKIDCAVNGGANGVITAGVQILGTSSNNHIDKTRVNAAAIVGGVKFLDSSTGTGNIVTGAAG